ncbi:MAG TPA: ABC transporter permease, partial [Thermoanaerobaculia bacterium]|nr:ABC transporter permease [Thermoanaerobaculia bacterium]
MLVSYAMIAADLCKSLYRSGRTFGRTPWFTLAITFSLALGIGLNGAAFSLFDDLLLSPSPGLRQPAELVLLFSQDAETGRTLPVSYPNFEDLRSRGQSFVSLSAYQIIRVGISAGGGEARMVPGEIVTADYFETLGVAPLLGRTFQQEEDSVGSEPVVVLGHGLWQQ